MARPRDPQVLSAFLDSIASLSRPIRPTAPSDAAQGPTATASLEIRSENKKKLVFFS